MKLWKPFYFEHSRLPIWLSKLAPINIGAISLCGFVFSREAMDERVKNHEAIHFQQQLELGFIFFFVVYLYDYLRLRLMGYDGEDAYYYSRSEQEAHLNDKDLEYLGKRKRYAWLKREEPPQHPVQV